MKKLIILIVAIISISASSLTTTWHPIYIATSNQRIILRLYNTSQFNVKTGLKNSSFIDTVLMSSGDTIFPSIRQLEFNMTQGDTLFGIANRNNAVYDTVYGINVVATGVK